MVDDNFEFALGPPESGISTFLRGTDFGNVHLIRDAEVRSGTS